MLVGAEGELRSREGGDEQKQSGMGKVEIREKTLDSFELVGGINVGGGVARVGAEVGRRLEDTGGGGSDGDDPAGRGDFFLKPRADLVFFLVHGVVAKIGGFDGAKSAEADVEGDKDVGKLGKQFRGEMESGGGCGHGAGNFGVGGLVGGEVGRIEIRQALPLAGLQDVGGEGRAAKRFKVELFHERTHDQLAAGDGFFDTEKRESRWGPVEGVWKEFGARGEAFGRGAESGPPAGAGFLKKQELGSILGADDPGGDNLGVIKDQKVVFLE